MYLELLDKDTFELIDIVSLYKSVIWETSYNTNEGNFQIDLNIEQFNKFEEDMLVVNSEDKKHIGVIKNIHTSKTITGDSLVVKGIMMEQELLRQRIAKGVITYSGLYPITIVSNLMGLSVIDPAEVVRKHPSIGNVSYVDSSNIPDMEKTEYSAIYPNLEEEIYTLIQGIDVGFEAVLNKSTNKIDLRFFVGEDHTEGTDNPIVLSRDRGTITSIDYTKDSSQNITNIYCIGEDNVYVECQKLIGEEQIVPKPRIEKSVDVSGNVPWPTYSVEKPEEDGGQYYQYKKCSNPEFITNMDVWEKYDVERIEKTETRYRDVKVESKVELSSSELGAILNGTHELAGSIKLDTVGGIAIGSNLSTKPSADSKKPNKPKSSTFSSSLQNEEEEIIGYGFDLTKYLSPASRARIESQISSVRKAANPFNLLPEESFRVVYPEGYRKPSNSDKILLKASSKNKKKQNKLVSKKLDSKVDSKNSSGGKGTTTTNKNDNKGKLQSVGVGALPGTTFTGILTTWETEEYEVTVVTYEVRDFVEYVYVNKGENPSNATKIIQGSVASGTVMYYEHFVDSRVTVQAYRDALSKYGDQLLKTFTNSEQLDVELYSLSNVVFGKDYKLGDLITAKDKDIDFEVDLRVVKAKEVWGDKGYKVSLTLGTNVPQLTQRIRMISKGGV